MPIGKNKIIMEYETHEELLEHALELIKRLYQDYYTTISRRLDSLEVIKTRSQLWANKLENYGK